jgi:predicted ATPase
MLERIHIENYKCLRDVTVELGDFTILIGPNDSGKSSFLEVVQTFGKLITQGYPATFKDDRSLANLVWGRDSGLDIVLELEGTTPTPTHRFVYRLEIPVDARRPRETLQWDGAKVLWTEEPDSGQGQPQQQTPPSSTLVVVLPQGQGKQQSHVPLQRGVNGLQVMLQQLQTPYHSIADALKSSVEYHFEPDRLPKAAIPTVGIELDPSGENLAAVLDVMQNSPDRSSFVAIQEALHGAIPTLRGIVLPPATQPPGGKALEFVLSRNGHVPVTIPGSLASGGALLLTAYLTLAYSQTPGLLLIEEPENGLHPSRLQTVLDLLRKMSRGEVGNRRRQVVVTTHNPLLLNYASPDEVRVFVRHPDQGTRVIPMTQAPDIDRLLKEFALGELWYLLGEEKLFQEQPV